MNEKLKNRSFGLHERGQWRYLFVASLFLLAPICVSAEGNINEKSVAVQQQAKKTVVGTVLDETGH